MSDGTATRTVRRPGGIPPYFLRLPPESTRPPATFATAPISLLLLGKPAPDFFAIERLLGCLFYTDLIRPEALALERQWLACSLHGLLRDFSVGSDHRLNREAPGRIDRHEPPL